MTSSRLLVAALSVSVLSSLGACAANPDGGASTRSSARGDAEYRTGSNIPRRGSAASDGVTTSTVDGLPGPDRSASGATR